MGGFTCLVLNKESRDRGLGTWEQTRASQRVHSEPREAPPGAAQRVTRRPSDPLCSQEGHFGRPPLTPRRPSVRAKRVHRRLRLRAGQPVWCGWRATVVSVPTARNTSHLSLAPLSISLCSNPAGGNLFLVHFKGRLTPFLSFMLILCHLSQCSLARLWPLFWTFLEEF